MLKAQCQKCLAIYYGWALTNDDCRCYVCGSSLKIIEDTDKDIIEEKEERVMDINKYKEWVKNDCKDRVVEITLSYNHNGDYYEEKVWCFDYDMMVGTYVDFPEDPPSMDHLKELKKEEGKRDKKYLNI